MIFDSSLGHDINSADNKLQEFHSYIMNNMMNELPRGTIFELDCACVTTVGLQVHYLVSVPGSDLYLSMVLGCPINNEVLALDSYLRCYFAILSSSKNEEVEGIRTMNRSFSDLKKHFYGKIIPKYERLNQAV